MKNNAVFPTHSRLSSLAFCTIVAVFSLPGIAQAQDWRFEPILSAAYEINDNATLTIRTDEEVKLQGYLLDAKANIRYSSPKTDFYMQQRVLLRTYPDDSDFDSDDSFLRSQYIRTS